MDERFRMALQGGDPASIQTRVRCLDFRPRPGQQQILTHKQMLLELQLPDSRLYKFLCYLCSSCAEHLK